VNESRRMRRRPGGNVMHIDNNRSHAVEREFPSERGAVDPGAENENRRRHFEQEEREETEAVPRYTRRR